MSTSASIIKENEDGTFSGIYCNRDGWPDRVGVMLSDLYDTEERVSELIALGDISSLGENIENTKAYHRDFEGSLDIHNGNSWEEVDSLIDGSYVYVFQNGNWEEK